MNSVTDHILDQLEPEDGPDKRLTTWYAQGQSDALGDRLLMFDNTNLPSWEILRFKPALAHEPRFEAALRERVEQLSSFQHQSFPVVRPIKRLGHDDGLAVVSTYSSGAPLADALKKPRSVDFSLRMLRQLMPALAAFHGHAAGVSHGMLTADRIVLNAEGRLMMREHMVGSALASLELPASRLWSEFGVLTPPSLFEVAPLDQRCDVAQLALIAVSLMAGRRLGPDEYPDAINDVLNEIARRQHAHGTRFETLRQWLERAIQLEGKTFESAQDADAALAEIRDEAPRAQRPPEPAPARATLPPPPEPPKADVTPPMWSGARTLPAAAATPPPPPDRESGDERTARDRVMRLWHRIPPPVIRLAAVALCTIAVVEAFIIGRLLLNRQSEPPPVETRAVAPPQKPETAAVEPVPVASPPAPPAQTAPRVVATATVEPKPVDTRPLPAPGPAVRTGGFRVTAPIEIHVLDGERVMGSSVDGPIMAPAGRREYDFVNSVIGFRVRRMVDVRAGQVTPVAVPVPNGTLNINADPWATVLIDGASVGETPLGNLSVVPGEHEIVFRHPQLGERRQRTIVRPDTETRVSVSMQK